MTSITYRPTVDFHQRFDQANATSKDDALDVVKSIHEAAGTPNTFEPDKGGFSGLYWVCLRGHYPAAEWLLAQGAEPNGDNGGRLPGTLLAAVGGGNPDVVKLLIEAGADINAKDVQLDTPILKAVNYKELQICRLLLDAGADPSLQNVAGVSALNTRVHVRDEQTFSELFHEYGHKPRFDVYQQSGEEWFQQWLAARRKTSDTDE